MPHKVKLILNPMADMGRAWKTGENLRPIAQEFQGDISWSGTVYPTHASELARQAAEEIIARRNVIRLNAADSRRFVEALLAPPQPPTPLMLDSVRLYRKRVKSDLD